MTESTHEPAETQAETQDEVETEATTNDLTQQDDADLAVDQAPVVDVDDEPEQ